MKWVLRQHERWVCACSYLRQSRSRVAAGSMVLSDGSDFNRQYGNPSRALFPFADVLFRSHWFHRWRRRVAAGNCRSWVSYRHDSSSSRVLFPLMNFLFHPRNCFSSLTRWLIGCDWNDSGTGQVDALCLCLGTRQRTTYPCKLLLSFLRYIGNWARGSAAPLWIRRLALITRYW